MERQVVSVFLQDEIRLIEDRLSLTLGSKFEHNDFTGFEYQPSARVLFTPTKKQSVWAAVSRAVHTPAISDNDIQIAQPPSSSATGTTTFPRILPNQNLDSEVLIAYELGYRAQATERLSFDTALFYNQYDRLFTNVVSPGAPVAGPAAGTMTLPLHRLNGASAETHGAEVSGTWQASDWCRVYGAYTFTQLHVHGATEFFEKQTPQNQFYLRSSFDLPGHVEFDVIGRYVDRISFTGTPIPSYISLDLRLAWKATPNLEFAVVAQNLLDSHHPEFGTAVQVRSPLVEVQRAVYAKVTYRF